MKLPSSSARPDPEIAHAAVDALRWNIDVPQDRVQVKVEKGWLTLEGDVDWYYQKEAAERAVRYLTGIKGVSNLITVRVRPTPSDVKQRIRQALERGAEFDAERISVEIQIPRERVAGYFEAFTKRFLRDGSPEAVDVEVLAPDLGDQSAARGARLAH